MDNENSLVQVAAALQKASRLLLLGHVDPDGDSLGSLLALRLFLLEWGKQVDVYVAEGIPGKYQFLAGAETVLSDPKQLPQGAVTVVVLDCGEWERTGLAEDTFVGYPVINIDHHRTSQGLGQVNYLDSEAAATGLLLFRLFTHEGVTLTPDMATCLYTAIVGDTGFFRYSNTTAEVHSVAAALLAAGAQQTTVYESLEGRSLPYLKALGLVLERLSSFAAGRGVYSYLTANDLAALGLTAAEVDGLVNYPRSLTGIEVAAFLTEQEPGVYKVSLRSRAPFDVSVVASRLGGGGHAQAAGCTMSGDITICIDRLAVAVAEVNL